MKGKNLNIQNLFQIRIYFRYIGLFILFALLYQLDLHNISKIHQIKILKQNEINVFNFPPMQSSVLQCQISPDRSYTTIHPDPIKFSWSTTNQMIIFPIYQTYDLNQINQIHIKSALLVQHGNLRNGNSYYCGVINMFTKLQKTLPKDMIILVPQFYSTSDICYDDINQRYQSINITDSSTWCNNYQIFSTEGWKDGHSSLDTSLSPPFFSYDIYNLILRRLQDPKYFPNLERITLFGFSAGAQVLLRYAAYPQYKTSDNITNSIKIDDSSGSDTIDNNNDLDTSHINNENIPTTTTTTTTTTTATSTTSTSTTSTTTSSITKPTMDSDNEIENESDSDSDQRDIPVHYVISDPSTYMYFDQRRPLVNKYDETTCILNTLTADVIDNLRHKGMYQSIEWITRNNTSVTGIYYVYDVDDDDVLSVVDTQYDINLNTHSDSIHISDHTTDSNPLDMNSKTVKKMDSEPYTLISSKEFTVSFGYPDNSWKQSWEISGDGIPWILDWNQGTCRKYNEFRYGLEALSGYYRYHASLNPHFVEDVVLGFPEQNIIYLAGLNDIENCHLHQYIGCEDNELAIYCEAMIQGNHRIDRMIKWYAYLYYIYGDYNINDIDDMNDDDDDDDDDDVVNMNSMSDLMMTTPDSSSGKMNTVKRMMIGRNKTQSADDNIHVHVHKDTPTHLRNVTPSQHENNHHKIATYKNSTEHGLITMTHTRNGTKPVFIDMTSLRTPTKKIHRQSSQHSLVSRLNTLGIKKLSASIISKTQRLYFVPDVTHDPIQMLSSPIAQYILFDQYN